jgi:serine/threonine protein kinase
MPQKVLKGTYGCVFNPPLKCDRDLEIDYSKYISKVFFHEDFLRKIVDNNKVLKPFFPDYINSQKVCKVHPDDLKKINNNGENDSYCNHKNRPFITYYGKYMILIPKYDGDLHELIVNEKYLGLFKLTSEIKVISLYETILENLKSLERLKTARILHNDIRFPNILFKIEDRKIKLQIIDFDLVKKYSEIKYDDWLRLISRNLEFFSYDFLYIIKSSKVSIDTMREYLKSRLSIVNEEQRSSIIEGLLAEIGDREILWNTFELTEKPIESFQSLARNNDIYNFSLIIYTLIWITMNNISKRKYELWEEDPLGEETEEMKKLENGLVKLAPLLKTMEELFTFDLQKRKTIETTIRHLEEQIEILSIEKDEMIV